MSDETKRCACTGCNIPIDPQQPFEREGKAYCCEACADHHPRGEPCTNLDCHCEDETVTDGVAARSSFA